MKINPYIFRGYDIRGIAGEDLNYEVVEAIGKAYGTLLNKLKIKDAVVGHDCRLSSEEYNEALIKGIVSTGINVVDIGLVMIQMMYFAQHYLNIKGGAMITASHNPAKYNGFKLANGLSSTLVTEGMIELREMVEQDNYFSASESGQVSKKNITEAYYKDILKRIEITKKLKVVVDTGMGTAGPFAPELFRRAGLEVIEQNTEVDGSFPIGTPDPTATDVTDRLRTTILKEQADLGIAFDGDGDRIGVVDNKGTVIWNDTLMSFFIIDILANRPGESIIYNTLCSQVVKKVIEAQGGKPVMWRTGHSFIKQKLAQLKGPFAGELSGHFFFSDNFYGHDDGTYAALRLLSYLTRTGKDLHQLYEELPSFISSPEIKVGCPDDKKIEVVKNIANKFKKDFPKAEITDDKVIPGDDGVRADFADGMIIFRYSQNGPYITVKFEAQDQAIYEERKKYVKAMLKSFPEMIWEDKLSVNLSSLD